MNLLLFVSSDYLNKSKGNKFIPWGDCTCILIGTMINETIDTEKHFYHVMDVPDKLI